MFAKVVVDVKIDNIKSNNLNETYDYIIPMSLKEFVGIGSRVLVPFGNQELLGYVLEINETSLFESTAKYILDVLDYDQELTEEQIKLAYYISDTYYVSIVSVLELMIPSFLRGQKRKYIDIVDYDKLHPSLAILFNGKKRLLIDSKIKNEFDLVREEIKKGNITLDYDLYTYGNGLKKREYYIKDDNPIFKSEKRRNIYNYVQSHPNVSEDDIISYIDCTYNLIREMCKDNTLGYHEVIDIDKESLKLENKSPYKFSFDEEQTMARYFNNSNLNNKLQKFLLHSNKEDFKINFYIKIIEENKKKNLPVLITAPTIMLAEEILMYLKRYLRSYKIYGMTSKNTKKERYEAFMNCRYDNLDVLVTTHNGIFLPFNKIGAVIVVDEENPNYINENYPYYNAIDVLRERAKMHNASILLTSSCPSISTYYKSVNGEYSILNVFSEVENKRIVIDMKEEILNGSSNILSNTLVKHMKDALENNKQVMLLVASKAYSNTLRCRECGKVLKCPTCNVPLTLYKEKAYAKCNYCDHKSFTYTKCSCGSEDIMALGIGGEKVIEEVKTLFPDAKILNVNADLMKTIDDYNKAINDIEENNVDIIIGTNILSKTLKNDNIDVIGLIDADLYLNSSNHKANEYTYNLISKLNKNKNVIIQTYHKDNRIINYAIKDDYDTYYANEIQMRKVLEYDPFNEISRIVISGEDIYHFANYYKKVYKGVVKGTILGPTYDFKLKGVKLILKHNDYEKVIKILNDTRLHFKKVRVKASFERCPRVL